jgi:cytochrome bd ubiquinol oxidase subunit I
MTSEILVPVQFAFTVAFHYYLPAFEHRAWGGSRDHGGLVAEDRECALSQHGALLDTDFRSHVRDRCGDRIVMEFEFGTNCATYSRFVGEMVALGARFSAVWIVVANSWMPTPFSAATADTLLQR